MYILHKIFSDSFDVMVGSEALSPLSLSLALWGQSLYGKLQCIPLIHFHGEKSIKAPIQLQQLLQDDVFVRPFKQNGQYIPNTPRQDRCWSLVISKGFLLY